MVGKKGIKIHNGTLLVKTHGLDALSLIACEHVTVDLTIKGPGIFPAIDTTTGYAEKGEARFGYDSALVLAPNNALDTSAYTGGAYAGVTGQFLNTMQTAAKLQVGRTHGASSLAATSVAGLAV